MTDSNLVRFLGRQTTGKVGLVAIETVREGIEAVRARLHELEAQGCRYAICDALLDDDLVVLGAACAEHALITGGSGIALGLPDNFRRRDLLPAASTADTLPEVEGHEAVIAGSCSVATLGQIDAFMRERPALKVDPTRLAEPGATETALAWARERLGDGPVLVYASARPDEVEAVQARLGRERAGSLVEDALAAIARGLVDAGVRRLVIAGGETAGAVMTGLGVTGLRIGPQIDPGVPACTSLGDPPLALALKSGNFGAVDFFTKAFTVMP